MPRTSAPKPEPIRTRKPRRPNGVDLSSPATIPPTLAELHPEEGSHPWDDSTGVEALALGGDQPGPEGAVYDPVFGHVASIDVDRIDLGPNVRVAIDGLEELAASISEHGVLQPIKVRPVDDRWMVVWGQRRLLAARLARLERIPALIDRAETKWPERSIEQLVENLHRADLNAIDRAKAMAALVDAGMTQAAIAKTLGIGASSVSNDLRLLGLVPEVQEKVAAGVVSASHAKAMAALSPASQRKIVERDVLGSAHDLEREIAWKTEAEQTDAEKRARTDKWIPKALAALVDVSLDAGVSVTGSYQAIDVDRLRTAVAAAGYKMTPGGERIQYGRPADCTCTAVEIEVGGRAPKLVEVCLDRRHVDRQVNVEHLASSAARDQVDATIRDIRKAVLAELAGLRPATLALLTWHPTSGVGASWPEHLAASQAHLANLVLDQAVVGLARSTSDLPAILAAVSQGNLVQPARGAQTASTGPEAPDLPPTPEPTRPKAHGRTRTAPVDAPASADPDACVRDSSGCATHGAVWIAADPTCYARGGRLSPGHELCPFPGCTKRAEHDDGHAAEAGLA